LGSELAGLLETVGGLGLVGVHRVGLLLLGEGRLLLETRSVGAHGARGGVDGRVLLHHRHDVAHHVNQIRLLSALERGPVLDVRELDQVHLADVL